MPVVFYDHGIRFHFFSNEGNPRERIHIHAERDDADAKLWVDPIVTVAKTFGYSGREQTMLVRIVEERREEIRNAWRDHFGEAP